MTENSKKLAGAWSCIHCGHGGYAHSLEGHPSFLCAADMYWKVTPHQGPARPDREAIARALFTEGVGEQAAAAWDTPGAAGRARWYAYADAVLALFDQEGQ